MADTNLHTRLLRHLRSWVTSVKPLHNLMRRDYEFVNNHQVGGTVDIQRKLSQTGRELLFFNEIRPQFELLSGHRSSQQLDYVAAPRSREDKRLGNIVSMLLKATYDVIKKDQIMRQVGDDGDICGLGVVHTGHTFDFAEDVVWGDLFIKRISPFSFVFDAWGTAPEFLDGKFMGHRMWLHEDDFKREYPKAKLLPPAEEWFSTIGEQLSDHGHVAPTEALANEFANAEKRHVAVFRLYYAEPMTLYYAADKETGDVFAGGVSEDALKKEVKEKLVEKVGNLMGELTVVPAPLPPDAQAQGIQFIVVDEDGNPMADETGQQPLLFLSEAQADEFITTKKKELSNLIRENWRIWTRKRNRIRWADLTAFEILATGELPVTAQHYPYRVYISRQLGDELEDIEGVVRQIIDRQKEVTKRYNHLADHLAHSAHSGWLNKGGNEGARKRDLELLGSRPGVVVEYTTIRPEKITPSEIPSGHFALLETNIGGMQRSTGINAEMLGLTSSSTVSGAAVTARQRGGITMQFGRIQNYMDFEESTAQQMLWHIQNSMPVEKMRRILGVWEAKTQSNILGQSAFLHPVSGEPVQEHEILDLLSTMKSTKFDLVLKPMPVDSTIREKQFTTALQMAQLVTQTGRPIGPTTFKELAMLSELPERLIASLEADAQAERQALAAQQQAEGLTSAINERKSQEGPNG